MLSFQLTQDDVDQGIFMSNATVRAADFNGKEAIKTAEASVELVRSPSISLGESSRLFVPMQLCHQGGCGDKGWLCFNAVKLGIRDTGRLEKALHRRQYVVNESRSIEKNCVKVLVASRYFASVFIVATLFVPPPCLHLCPG